MSVQPKTDIVSNAYPVLPPIGSNIVALNGKERTIEPIKIDDPEALDAEIFNKEEKREFLRFRERVLFIATMVFMAFCMTLMLACSIWQPIGLYIAGAFLATVGLPFCWSLGKYPESYNFRHFERLRQRCDVDLAQLRNCQNAMRTEEFQDFAKPYGKELSLDGLLKVHELFQLREIGTAE